MTHSGDNQQQRKGRDVDISLGVDPLISGDIIASEAGVGDEVGGGSFTPDASELISETADQMLWSQTRQFTKPSDHLPAFNIIWPKKQEKTFLLTN